MRIRKNIFRYALLTGLTLVLVLLAAAAPRARQKSSLIIYDVHPDSPRIIKDDGTIEIADYVRIKNVSDQPCDLTGLFLSDSRSASDKLPLDGIVVESGDSVMIKLDPSWNFALKSSGQERVYLSDRKGNILFKYTPDMKPKAPELSAASGFYNNEFYLSMLVKGEGKIYYTLDGKDPDETSEEYSGPIRVYDRSSEPNSIVNIPGLIKNYLEDEIDGEPIDKPVEEPVDKAFIVRAAVIDEYGNRSDIVSREYFFCGDKYKNIISIVADRDDLFGDYGIATVGKDYDEWYLGDREGEAPSLNYLQKGREWEIPSYVDYFRSGTMVWSQKCGLKLFGKSSRYEKRLKSFQLRARNCYSGSDVLEYDFFDDEKYRCDRITLDDGFFESFFFSIVDDEDIIKHKTTDRAALFVNGEFWNNVYIRQKYDEKYFADHFDIDPANLIVINETFPEIGGDDEQSYEEARGMYLALQDFATENDLSDPANYEKIGTMMDIDSFITFLALNTWVGNYDWDEWNNRMCWRVKEPYDAPYCDGRFRWMLHDGDFIFSDMVSVANPGYVEANALLGGLMKNGDFRKKFADRITELGTTTFSDEHVSAELAKDKWDEPEKQQIEEFFKTRKDVMVKLADDLNL